MIAQCDLDLARLDPVSMNLHLIIDASEELDASVAKITDEVARLIQSLATSERVGNELLGRRIRSIDVPARHPTSPDIQFAGGGDWNRPQPFVENINLLVGQRTTEGYCACSAVAFVNL